MKKKITVLIVLLISLIVSYGIYQHLTARNSVAPVSPVQTERPTAGDSQRVEMRTEALPPAPEDVHSSAVKPNPEPADISPRTEKQEFASAVRQAPRKAAGAVQEEAPEPAATLVREVRTELLGVREENHPEPLLEPAHVPEAAVTTASVALPEGYETPLSEAEDTGSAASEQAPAEMTVNTMTAFEVDKRPEEPPVGRQTGDMEKRVALLPFENFTDDIHAPEHVMPALKATLAQRGMEVVNDSMVTEFLCNERIRTTTYLPRETAQRAGRSLKANTMLAGAVVAYSGTENPGFGILARLVDTASGDLVWADYASATGDDFTGILGLGKIRDISELVPRVLDRLFATYPGSGGRGPISSYRIAVLPFRNVSSYPDAGGIVTHLFLVHLFKNGVLRPVEYGDVRSNVLAARVRRKGELSFEKISDLQSSLDVNAILVGTIERYTDGIPGSSPPAVTVTARLLDARTNRILWYNTRELNGEDKIIAFDWRKLRSADRVASAAVADLLAGMEKEVVPGSINTVAVSAGSSK